MIKTLYIITITSIEEYNCEVSLLGAYSTLEGATDTLYAYLKERFVDKDIDRYYSPDRLEWAIDNSSEKFGVKIHTFDSMECQNEISLILHTTVDNDNSCDTKIEFINESFDITEKNLLPILHAHFINKVEYNDNGGVECDGEPLTFSEWIDSNFASSLKWIAIDKNQIIHQYTIESTTIDSQPEEEWADIEETDIITLLELFSIYQDMGYEWMIANPLQLHPTLNNLLSLITKEEFASYFADYQQKSSEFFAREESDESFDAIEASNEVLNEILQSILVRK